jgi:outer membrane protein
VEMALVAHNNARYDVRALELKLTTDVTTAYLNLQTAEQTAALQRQTAEQAHTALTYQQQRYRVGLATFVDVAQARDTYEKAENERITSEYDYMKDFADLEGAVGRSLRP